MKKLHLILAAAVAWLGAGALSAQPRYLAQPEAIASDAPYAHVSGIVFPASVGAFRRVSLLRYDADGLDMSAGYNLIARSGGVAATVYVSPAPSAAVGGGAAANAALCRREFEAMKQAVAASHAGVTLLQEKPVALVQGDTTHDGRMAAFTYDETGGGAHRTLRSELYVFCGVAGKWAIEYRFSYPQGFDAAEQDAGFMRDLHWTLTTDR